ncbi:uncharacterized protein LOC101860759, partial [Aplysia californica]|uniref:Uncharacterized protein LOC101860759 n=1 Tax=Aplysia californica TaxID=6500 RepID=A0ABM1A603_APLCA
MDDGFQHSVSVVSDLSVLTYVQANQLLQMLDNTKAVIENYVQILEENSHVKHKVRQKSWWGRHCWPNKRRILYKYVTIITLCLQVFNLLVLTVIDAWPRHDTGEHQFMVASSTTMIIMQVLNLILIILASGRLVKQIYRHSVNNFFLAQAYLATLLLFAGIYTTTYRMDVSHTRSWKFVNEDLNEDPAQVFVLYAKFLFYSISTATLCGSDNVLPVEWYNCIFAGIQMLLSFCYFASILGIAMAPDVTSFFKSTNLKSKKDAASSPATQEEQQQQQQQ